MFLGELPDLRDTRSGQGLIDIGREEGRLHTLRATIIRIAKERFQHITPEFEAAVNELASAEQLEAL
ncbi:MAG: hypothetical protein CMJ78_09495 [Planctomycetaceae bacterium]|nr:hypothetical protein [Planctomycetaceae bacterium]